MKKGPAETAGPEGSAERHAAPRNQSPNAAHVTEEKAVRLSDNADSRKTHASAALKLERLTHRQRKAFGARSVRRVALALGRTFGIISCGTQQKYSPPRVT
jgi:hypothetical protein